MLPGLLVVASVILGHPIGATVRHRIGPISFELPATWRQSSRSGTTQFDSAEGQAYLLIDISEVETPNLTPEQCREKVLRKLAAGVAWKLKQLDTFAAAHEVAFERSPNLATTARVERLIGCDGNYAWSMVFFIELANWTHFSQVTAHVVETLMSTHLKPGSPETRLLEDEVRNPSTEQP